MSHYIVIQQEFPQPIGQVFAALSQHATYNQLFAPLQVERSQDSTDQLYPDGVGSVRNMGFGGFKPLQEQITVFEPNRKIEYQIIHNPMIKQHLGSISFSAITENVTLVTYRVALTTRVPFAHRLILPQLKWVIQRGLRKLVKQLSQ